MAGVYQGDDVLDVLGLVVLRDDVLDVLGLVVLSLKTLQKKFCDSTNFGLYNA